MAAPVASGVHVPRRRRPSRDPLGFALFAAALVPFVVTAADALRGKLGANPVESVLDRLGLWTLIFLLASLACTPARILLRTGRPARYRRMLGLFAFWTGVVHLSFYVGIDQGFDWNILRADVTKRKFMIVGLAALLLLLPLAVTSTHAMIRRLGSRRWRRLHRLAYPAAVLGVVHFYWRVKADHREPLIFALILAVLLAVRAVDGLRRRARQRGAASTSASTSASVSAATSAARPEAPPAAPHPPEAGGSSAPRRV